MISKPGKTPTKSKPRKTAKQNVTHRAGKQKQMEEALRRSEAELREAQRVARLGSWSWDARTDEISWSEEYCHIYGFDPSRPPPGYKEHLKAYTPESAAQLDAAVKKSMETGEPYALDLEQIRPDGTSRWITARGEAKRDSSSQIIGLRGTAQDITERKQAEEALRKSEERYRSLFNNIDEGVAINELVFDKNGDVIDYIILEVNPNFTKHSAYTTEEVVGRRATDLYKIDCEYIRGWWKEHDNFRQSAYTEMHHESSDRWFSISTTPPDGKRFATIFTDITERKKANDTLQKAEEKYRTIFSESIEGIFQSTLEGKFLTANPALAHMWGYESPEELISSIQEISSQIYADPSRRDEFTKVMRQDGQVYGFEYQVRRKDGGTMWVSENARAVCDDKGTLLYYEGHIEDITKRRQAEKLVRENEEKYHSLFENAPFGILLVNPHGEIVEVNPAALQILGSPSAEATKNINILTFQPLIEAGIVADFQMAVDTAQSAIVEHPYTTKWEKSIQMSMRFTPLLNANGQVEQIQVIIEDITERKLAELALQESETRYRAVMQKSLEAIYVCDSETHRIVESNPAFLNILGYTVEEAHSLTIYDVIAHDRQSVDVFLRKIVSDGGTSIGERLWRRKDGTIVPMEVTGNVFPQDGKDFIFIIGRDISERKHAEAALQRSAEEYQHIINTSLDGFWRLDEKGKILDVNESYCRMSGYSREELLNMRVRDVDASESEAETAQRMAQIKETGRSRFEVRHRRKDGSIMDVEVNTIYLPSSEQFITFYHDITQRKRNDEKIRRQLERLTALKSIDQIITSNFDLKISLGMMLTQVINQLQVDAADILVFNPTLNALEFRAGHGFRTRGIEKVRVRLGEGYAGRAALDRRMVRVTNLKAETRSPDLNTFIAFEGFVSYYCVPLIAKGHVKGVMEIFHRSTLHPEAEWLDFLETLAQQAAIAVDNIELFDNLQRTNHELGLAYDATIEGWSRAMDLRDKESEGHTQRVTEMAVELAGRLGISDDRLIRVRWGALLHDIGKMGIPDEILHKSGKLNEDEWNIVKRHPHLAYEMLSPIHYLRSALDIPYCHHEKWDGTGYPRGLKGEQIPLEARLFSVVDVWNALTSDRPYRAAWSKEKTRQHILESSGTFFDPAVVKVFLESGLTERY